MKLTKRVRSYLQKKLLGGFINQRGNTYENYFALFKILQKANKYSSSLSTIQYSAQETEFVDDLLVLEGSKRFLYQLKTSKRVSWGSGLIKTLKFDFVAQKQREIFYKRQFELTLVVSSPTLQSSLVSTLPKGLRHCTNVFMFPYYETITKQILYDPAFRTELENLSAINNPTTDKLDALASCLLGFWEASSKKGILLSEIINKVENLGFSFIKPRVIHTLSHNSKSILDVIPDFKYLESNGYFAWTYKATDSGIIPYPIGSAEFNNIEKDIQLNKPTAFKDLEIIIS